MKYIKKIVVQTPSTTRDEYGQPVEEFSNTFTTGAYIRRDSSSESSSGTKETNSTIRVFEVRRTPSTASITTNDKLQTSDSGNWDITHVDTVLLEHLRIVLITAVRRL